MSRTYVPLSNVNGDELCSYEGFFDKGKISKVVVFKPFSFKIKNVGKRLNFFSLVVKNTALFTLEACTPFCSLVLWTHSK